MARTGAQQQEAGSGPQHPGYPALFGKYVLVRPLARGGMGELFLAAAGETDGFEKMCVVKKVLHSVEDQGVHRRFLDEAKVVVRLNHPNLVQVFDAGRVDDEYYLAMELVEGKDLRAVWNRCAQLHRRIAVDVAIYVVREVLRGLEYAHDAGKLDLVHRDISPPNILVGYRGDVKLTDFGLAKSAIKKEMTTPGVVFGRYSYLSPEQSRGLSADRRTDLYACGIVLWELLTGRQLFPSAGRNHQEALAAVRDPKVKRPSQLVPGVPEGLDDVVLQALAKDPRDRYQNSGAFRAALSDVLADHFPKCDADRTSEFMRDIFAREVRTEARDIANVSHLDFAELRSAGDDSESISINDLVNPSASSSTSTVSLLDSDIVELEKARRGGAPPRPEDLEASARQWIGTIVGQRYRIDSLIGIGGMGAVFSATHMALTKTFALKVLHPVYTRDADIVDRFMREARAATQTGHPNIIDVVDIGTTEDDDVYFVMELLEGRTLADVLADEGPLAVRRAVHIARQICRALAAAHEVGIIHRDLKTDNIILTTVGKDPDFVKVLDFGICKTAADPSSTSPGMVMGSPDYMAPEQGAGLPATVASDVYAAGCILFEMLAGQLPFSGRNAIDVLMQKGSRDAEPVTAFRAEVPEPVAEVIAHCLVREASDRPQSMRSLEYELTRAVDGRAQAVAAVLGLNMAGDSAPRSPDDPSPDASASFHRAAIASLDFGPGGSPKRASENTAIAPHPRDHLHTGPERTVIAPPPQRPVHVATMPASNSEVVSEPELSKANATALAAAKAMFFVLLGGGIASLVVFASRSDPDPAKAAAAAT
ncbi:MAG: protein kinase, partial [Myxococcota bacterium]